MKRPETPHSESLEQVLAALAADEAGLSSAQAQERHAHFGPNQLQGKKQRGLILRFWDQLKDPMILILLAAAAISFVLATQHDDPMEYFEPLLILAIVVANAIMGVVQESKAEKALEALKQMSAPHARVLRGGAVEVISSDAVVPGDIVLVEAGDFIPADGRLIEDASLKSEESALTGESVPTQKDARVSVSPDAPLGDRLNMVFSGCSVAYGRGKYVVTATGMDTEMGRIAKILNAEDDGATPLQHKLARLSKILGIGALFVCAVIFLLGYFVYRQELMDIFMTAVSLAVSAIPEGLPAIVTIVLAIGVQRMVKKNAIIRRLPAVETLGSASVICSDKTGTLTQNRMTLIKAYSDEGAVTEDITKENGEAIRSLLQYATLCCDGEVSFTGGTPEHIGDPTETCIVLAAHQNGLEKKQLTSEYPRLAEVPFDSDRKLMSVICRIDGKNIVITKGAPDALSALCVNGDLDKAGQLNAQMGEQALRVLAVGWREIDEIPSYPTPENIERELTFMGLVGMIDPPRPEVRDAVQVCRDAGIRPVMITGDHVLTASAIAKDLGILTRGDRAVTGAELSEMSDEQLAGSVREIAVYARVSPEDKIRVVKAWQEQGEVVAMTGDGVNDAPALKAADIGCAMGITGTDVAKGAADMTLTDDNFTTIVDAVKEGRGIYDNIKKVVAFLLGTNIGEVLSVFTAMLIWQHTPLVSMQLLWINLVTDGLPAIALGREAVEDGVMLQMPRPKNEGIFAHGMAAQVVLQGVMFGALTLIAYAIGYAQGGDPFGQTMAFMVLAFTQIFHSFNMRSKRSLFKIGIFTNRYLNSAALLSIAMMLGVLFIPPVAMAFELILLPPMYYLIGLGLALTPIPVLEAVKAIGILRHEHDSHIPNK